MRDSLIRKYKNAVFLKYLRNTAWLLFEQCLRIISGLLVGIWIARYLGPDTFGQFNFFLIILTMLAVVSKVGMDAVLIRELTSSSCKTEVDYLGTSFWLRLSLTTISCLIIILYVVITTGFNSDGIELKVLIIFFLGPILNCFEVIEFNLQAKIQGKIIAICKLIQLLLSTSLKIYLLVAGADISWFLLAVCFDSCVLALIFIIAHRYNKFPRFYRNFDICIAKKLISECWPLLISAFVVTAYMRVDQLMLRDMVGNVEAGIYAASSRLIEASHVIPTIIVASLYPAIMKLKNISTELYEKRNQHLYGLLYSLAILQVIFVYLYGEDIINKFFGLEYQAAAEIYEIHSWSAIFVFIAIASAKYLVNERMVVKDLHRNLFGLILNIVLNIYLIPKYAGQGAAVATLISWMFSGFIYDFIDVSTRKMGVHKLKSMLILIEIRKIYK